MGLLDFYSTNSFIKLVLLLIHFEASLHFPKFQNFWNTLYKFDGKVCVELLMQIQEMGSTNKYQKIQTILIKKSTKRPSVLVSPNKPRY